MNNHVYLLHAKWLETDEVFRYWYQKMPAERRKKIDAFRLGKDQRLSLGAGILLQHGFRQAGIEYAALSYGPHGKPSLADGNHVHFNLTHSGRMAACAISNHPVGIDIEEERRFEEDFCRYVFQDREIEWVQRNAENANAGFTALWTIKESLMKYWGTGVSLEPKTIFIDQNEPIRAVCKDFSCQKLHFTRYALQGYQLTVCSEYRTFSDRLDWLLPANKGCFISFPPAKTQENDWVIRHADE